MEEKARVGYAYIRLFMAVSTDDSYDIRVNDTEVKRNFKFGDFTEYKRALAGKYRFSIYPVNGKGSPLLDKEITILDGEIYTICFTGEAHSLHIDTVPDTIKHTAVNTPYVRFIHLSPDTPSVDIHMDNKQLISKMSYLNYTDYYKISSGSHHMAVYATGTPMKILTNPNASFKGDNYYACYLVGLSEGKPPLQVVLPLEGASYLND